MQSSFARHFLIFTNILSTLLLFLSLFLTHTQTHTETRMFISVWNIKLIFVSSLVYLYVTVRYFCYIQSNTISYSQHLHKKSLLKFGIFTNVSSCDRVCRTNTITYFDRISCEKWQRQRKKKSCACECSSQILYIFRLILSFHFQRIFFFGDDGDDDYLQIKQCQYACNSI